MPVGEVIDGTPDGSPEGFFAVGRKVFFVAEDGVTGRELWALDHPLGPLVFEDGFESGSTNGWSAAVP